MARASTTTKNNRKKSTTAKKPAASAAATENLGVHRAFREGLLLLCLAVAVYLLIALLSYRPDDPAWLYHGEGEIRNLAGVFGAYTADVLLFTFGYMAYPFPFLLGIGSWLLLHGKRDKPEEDRYHQIDFAIRVVGLLLTLIAGSALATIHFIPSAADLPAEIPAGGVVGNSVAGVANSFFGVTGGTLILLALFLMGFTWLTRLSWLGLMERIGSMVLWSMAQVKAKVGQWQDYREGQKVKKSREEVVRVESKKSAEREPVRIEPKVSKIKVSERAEKEKQTTLFDDLLPPSGKKGGALPTLSLLDEPKAHEQGLSKEALEAIAKRVEFKLKDFGIKAEVVEVHPGPVVTRFELNPAPGVKGSQIVNLSKDLARALSVMSVRVVEVIPGKPYVGLEVPNEHRETVQFSEIIASQAFEQAKSPLTLGLGKDIAGLPVVADLGKMPHLLVAGTTGSGKSVAVNAMLLSLLYKATPDQVRMIMVDPKMLELSVYEGIPHLLAPVVTDMKEAANALRWCVAEMERRYKLMSTMGVRNLAGYNKKITDAVAEGKPIVDPFYIPPDVTLLEEGAEIDEAPTLDTLPMIVIIIDELADMMMVVGKKVEELIARIAQKARAAGLHLIVATQRPSVDVITGLIKANIPTRIGFQVSSKVDSRTILDQMGAEQLLGMGDMLYLPPGRPIPERVHGAFVDDHEVHNVVEFLKKSGTPEYIDDILSGPAEGGELPGEGGSRADDVDAETDALYDEAVAIVTESRRASISYVQRRLRIGYNRSARIIEQMEAAGVVSPVESNGNREVLAPPPPKD